MRLRIIPLFFVLFILPVAVAFPTGSLCADEHSHPAKVKDVYYCPMHPDYTSDKPGSCPICGMDLVRKRTEPEAEAPATETVMKERRILFYRNPMDPSVTSPVPMKDPMGMDYVPVYEEAVSQQAARGVSISVEKQQLIGVKKDLVRKRHLLVPVLMVGKIAYDPDLYSAQEAYLQALKAAEAGGKEGVVNEQSSFITALERKLILSGMSKEEIQELKVRGVPQDGLYLPSSSGKAWVYLTAYASDMGQVRAGQKVVIDSTYYPGEVFNGEVTGVSPVLDTSSRSARVRALADDPEGKLRPEMFVNARMDVDLGEKLSVPVSAVMDTGLRKIVHVVKGNRFIPREVALGAKAGDHYEVLGGLEEGTEVVTSGNFLIDAETRMQGARE